MRYGDYDNVPKDVRILFDIINRQGISLLIDCIAEYIGNRSLDLTADDILRLKESVISELTEAINERT